MTGRNFGCWSAARCGMLKTEMRNPNTMHIDRMSPEEMVQVMQQENLRAAAAVGEVLPAIAAAIDRIGARMQQGGRLIYVGCGTSGRLGVLDASEVPPTFGAAPEQVVGVIAGGDGALRRAVESVEDDAAAGVRDLEALQLSAVDTVVGISVAGGAAYVVAALEYAKRQGALTVGITSNAGSPVSTLADIAIDPDTGAEVITGSTRMKAGTAHKMILNMLSTGAMIRTGKVYENLMVHIRPVNRKLRQRMIRIVCTITGRDETLSEQALEQADWDIPAAVQRIQA